MCQYIIKQSKNLLGFFKNKLVECNLSCICLSLYLEHVLCIVYTYLYIYQLFYNILRYNKVGNIVFNRACSRASADLFSI